MIIRRSKPLYIKLSIENRHCDGPCPRKACAIKFETTRPSLGCMRAPVCIKDPDAPDRQIVRLAIVK